MPETLHVDVTGYDVVEICGVRFAVKWFEYFGHAPVNGNWVQIVKRDDDGTVTLRALVGEKAERVNAIADEVPK